MLEVVLDERDVIGKHGRGFFKRDTVLANILASLVEVPFEIRNHVKMLMYQILVMNLFSCASAQVPPRGVR